MSGKYSAWPFLEVPLLCDLSHDAFDVTYPLPPLPTGENNTFLKIRLQTVKISVYIGTPMYDTVQVPGVDKGEYSSRVR